ncbi:MAG: 30S ribosomal protein S20, partial [bacterium]|nr:30S ribosomal protein S20 [bacterium]
MPQHKSAKKRVKTNLKRQIRNRALRSTLKTDLKGLNALPEDQKDAAVKGWQSALDKAVNKGIVNKNKAARLKSRIASKTRPPIRKTETTERKIRPVVFACGGRQQ